MLYFCFFEECLKNEMSPLIRLLSQLKHNTVFLGGYVITFLYSIIFSVNIFDSFFIFLNKNRHYCSSAISKHNRKTKHIKNNFTKYQKKACQHKCSQSKTVFL